MLREHYFEIYILNEKGIYQVVLREKMGSPLVDFSHSWSDLPYMI